MPAARPPRRSCWGRKPLLLLACNCYHKVNYGRTDFETWSPHDKDRQRWYAEQWRDAPSSVAREQIFKEHGVRYSELWRLPYWDPSRQLVIDSMHCILEGLVQHHVRNLLALTNENTTVAHSTTPAYHFDFKQVAVDIVQEDSMPRKEITQVLAIHKLLVAQMPPNNNQDNFQSSVDALRESILRKNARPLRFVCESLGCIPVKAGKKLKADYAKALVQWQLQEYS
ncbi:hypothetical protein EV363DRAFT_1462078 [Boletus edulis]|nr:hypothetical protein EV363DRAFT_1462078 [Boletus edulis]